MLLDLRPEVLVGGRTSLAESFAPAIYSGIFHFVVPQRVRIIPRLGERDYWMVIKKLAVDKVTRTLVLAIKSLK